MKLPKRLKILVVYYIPKGSESAKRNTLSEHLYSIERYSENECYYINTVYGFPRYIDKIHFNMVLFHYTFLSLKWGGEKYFKRAVNSIRNLSRIKGYKAIINQDEYLNSEVACWFCKEYDVRSIFTCLPSSEWEKVYPLQKSGVAHIEKVFTGYVDEGVANDIKGDLKSHSERTIDIGYRARKVPYWLGRQGTLKWLLTEQIEKQDTSGLRIDVSNDEGKTFEKREWLQFLSECRVVLGCEGGASVHDPDGSIREKVDAYVALHTKASFEEVERECLSDADGSLDLKALSPRHFEACITKTCQALVEGSYEGILKKDVHFIEIRKDWSNLQDVINKIRDTEYCEKLADNAYRDIVQSKKYSYRSFVEQIVRHCLRFSLPALEIYPKEQKYLKKLAKRHKRIYFRLFCVFPTYFRRIQRIVITYILNSLRLLDAYERLKRRIQIG